ncbi:Glyoxylase, beta-lactamase superfamily II [Micromonospora pattaloongensis]|uniref:Glyoxylase, beta-lactamase superfamily II n=1 Tax=Micromonospora pattaloongensis TaxID=405436 RepID=A0A1H3Q9W4_9ACTN|nr:MBL fold metallo-hydrolase [Micromonospora pattaloongensis]SDZ09941.1 Glyoxylase, beta-lactamase superfamily II [Micromonospora pattaloongensis]
MAARIDHTVTSGTFSLDGQTWHVDNNVWVIGDDDECVVIDAPHDVETILGVVGGRRVVAVLATHAHDDHVRAAPALASETRSRVLLHPDDRVLWDLVHPDVAPQGMVRDGETVEVAGTTLRILHTPGHSPGACCVYAPELGVVFTGDTLFAGGPGATGRSYSDFGTIIESIRTKLLTLPPETVVHTGHGDSTTIGAEAPHLDEWIARGH